MDWSLHHHFSWFLNRKNQLKSRREIIFLLDTVSNNGEILNKIILTLTIFESNNQVFFCENIFLSLKRNNWCFLIWWCRFEGELLFQLHKINEKIKLYFTVYSYELIACSCVVFNSDSSKVQCIIVVFTDLSADGKSLCGFLSSKLAKNFIICKQLKLLKNCLNCKVDLILLLFYHSLVESELLLSFHLTIYELRSPFFKDLQGCDSSLLSLPSSNW